MPRTTITLDENLKARLAHLASQAGQEVDEFVEGLLRRLADSDVSFERGVPVFAARPGAAGGVAHAPLLSLYPLPATARAA